MLEVMILIIDSDLGTRRSASIGQFENRNPADTKFDSLVSFGALEGAGIGTFGDALAWLQAGYKVLRPHWDGSHWIMRYNRFYIISHGGISSEVTPSRGNLLATDWTIYVEEEVNV